MQEFFPRPRIIRKLRKNRALDLLKDSVEKLCLEGWQEASQVCMQVDEFHGGMLGHSQESSKKKQTVGILRGGFTIFHELLDLAEVQGRYGRVFPIVRSLGGVEPLIRATRAVGFTRGFIYRGFVDRNSEILQ
jgi:hypothetical protein